MRTLELDRRGLLGALGAAAFAGAAPGWAKGRAEFAALRALVEGYVAKGRVPGAVVAVVRPGSGAPDYVTVGRTAFEGGVAVTPDTLWRIYSMSKPVTGMAVMQQVARGAVTLDTPVAAVLPEFSAMRVLVDPAKGLEARAAKTAMTVRHLLTHTAGLSYTIVGNGPLEKEYRRLGLMPGNATAGIQPGDGAVPDLQTFVKRLATLPLHAEPGTLWRYSVALDVAGALLERLTGKTFDKVLAEQIFGPLGMASTGFSVAARDLARLSSNYAWAGQDMKPADRPVLIDGPARTDWTNPKMFSGGAGLLSSARDYARFGQMLLNEGVFAGRTVIPRGTARLAMSNLLPPGLLFEGRDGFGAAGQVTLADTRGVKADGVPAELYRWGGAASTLFQVDPVRQVAVVVMLQSLGQKGFEPGTDLQVALNRDMA